MAAKDIDPLAAVGANDVAANKKSVETSAQQWVESCGVCHVGGGSLEYDRDLNWYSTANSGSGDAFLIKYASKLDPSFVTVSPGYMTSSNKAEMDCLMCHLDGSNPGAAWLRTLGCGPNNPVGPAYDPTCIGTADGHGNPMGRTINSSMEDKVGEYDMFNRNFALKQYKPGLAASMGAGATGIFTGTELTGVDWGPTAAAPIKMTAGRIVKTPKSENCSVCHARYDDTMGLPGMMAMKTGFGNFDLLYRPDAVGDVDVPIPAGIGGVFQDLDTDNGATGVNDDFFQDFGCKTGMGKRAHKVNDAGDNIGANARYGMTPMRPSTMDADAGTKPNVGDAIAGKMPDIDVHNTAGMQCATCHYALGSDNANGYIDIPARNSHGSLYPAERIYAADHQFAQADSFPDVKGKENLDNMMRCESCHITQNHPNTGTAVIPAHAGFSQVHFEKIGCATCHIPETYSAPGRLKYRDFSAGFWHHAQKNVLDWNYDLMTGSHNTVPSLHRWLNKSANIADEGAKIYPVLPSVMPTWFQVVPDSGDDRDDNAKVCLDGTDVIPADVSALDAGDPCNNGTPATRTGTVGEVAATAYAPAYKACFDGAVIAANMIQYADVSPSANIGDACNNSTAATLTGTVALASDHDDRAGVTYSVGTTFSSPVKTRDAALAAEYVRDNGGVETGDFIAGKGDGVCGPAGTCIGGINAGDACMDRTDCTKFDIRVNGANTFPLFDGFQLADGLEIDTKAEVDAMLAAFATPASGADAPFTKFMALVQVDFDVTHGIVPKEWALGGSKRGGCLSCHSSKDPASPNYSEHSVGFFEGYVQPMDKAGMMVGAYDLIKNWTAMFADFDCTAFCGMGQQVDSDFFHPMTGQIQTGAECTAGSMFATIDQCVGMMTTKFDEAMGFPAGTAMMMGMYDGIAGLQGFTINTLQTIGYQGCNPFGGPTSGNSPAGSVNKCMPAPGLSPGLDGMLALYTGAPAGGLATCNGTTHVCNNGFRTGGGCANDADCQGSMDNMQEIAHNPMGLILSRKEVRSRQKIDLQQGYPDNDATLGSNIRWGMKITKNPGNALHVNEWDQAEYCIDRNPADYPNPFAPGAISCRAIPYTYVECTDTIGLDGSPRKADGTVAANAGEFAFCSSAQSPDGQRHIMHMMTANQYLGYTEDKLAELMTAPVLPVIHSNHVQYACTTCHANGGSDYTLVSGINTAAEPDVPWFTFTWPDPKPATGQPNCTTACHVIAAAPAQNTVVTARISDKHSMPSATDVGSNFTVKLDGSASTCYAVNRVTGEVGVTPGTKTYAWTYQDTAPASTSACPAPRAADPSCVVATWAAGGTNGVTLEVTCVDGATNPTASKTVAVTGIDIGAGAQTPSVLTAARSGQIVTLSADVLDTDVATVSITWGDGKPMSTISGANALLDFADSDIGIIHTYQGGKTYSISATTTNDGSPNNKKYTYKTEVYVPAP